MTDSLKSRVPHGPWSQLAGSARGKLEDLQGGEAGQYGERASMSVAGTQGISLSDFSYPSSSFWISP